jgi:hypothetical protein
VVSISDSNSTTVATTHIFTLILNITEVPCNIWGFHGGGYEEWRLLGRYAV